MFISNSKWFVALCMTLLLVLGGCSEGTTKGIDPLEKVSIQETKNIAEKVITTIEELVQLRPMNIGGGEITFGSIPKWDYSQIGAVAALNKYLAEKQEKLLSNINGTIILRYEIIEAGLNGVMPDYSPESGYLLGVRIYWSKFADSELTPEEHSWVIKKGGISGKGHDLTETWYQDYLFNLIPEKVSKSKDGQNVIIKVSEWKVNEKYIKCIKKAMVDKKDAPYIYTVPWPLE